MYFLGIDYGTGGAKAAVIDKNADILGYAFEEYKIYTDNPGWSEHDAVEYWNVACRLIRKSIEEAKISPQEIKGIAVSSALPSMVMVDTEGNPIARAYNLMDRRATKQVESLKREIGEDKLFGISKNRLDDHPTIVNLLWEKENRPDIFNKIYKVLTIDGFIVSKLTGKYTLHYSGAAFYGVAYDLEKQVFKEDILKQIDLPLSIFPDLYASDDIVGEVTAAAGAGDNEFLWPDGSKWLFKNWDGVGPEFGASDLDHKGNTDKSVNIDKLESGESVTLNILIEPV
jgi:xylulokinase